MSVAPFPSKKERRVHETRRQVVGLSRVATQPQWVMGMSIQSGKYRNETWRNERGISVPELVRKNSAEKTQHFSAGPAHGTDRFIGAEVFAPLTTRELHREVQCVVLSFSTGEIVEDTQASPRAIETVRSGEGGMSLKTFVNLCRANVRVRAMVAPLLGYGLESDPEVVHAISTLFNHLVRIDSPDTNAGGGPPASGNSAHGVSPSFAVGDLFEAEA